MTTISDKDRAEAQALCERASMKPEMQHCTVEGCTCDTTHHHLDEERASHD